MIIDNETQLTTATAFDLGSVRPGPGKPIKMAAIGVDAALIITTGATSAAAGALQTVVCSEGVTEFELPSDTLQYIKATFAAGTVGVVMDAQTNA